MEIKSSQLIIGVFLIIISIVAICIGMDGALLFNESLVKFAMNGILVLSLIPMINAGIGMNFGLPIGISAGLLGLCISVNMKLTGMAGFIGAIAISIPIAMAFGLIYGIILNKVKGREDIAGTFIGFSFIPLMSYFWTLAPFTNRKMLYPIGGTGLRPRIGLEPYFSQILNDLWMLNIGGIQIPLGLMIFYILIALFIHLLLKSKYGRRFKAVGESPEFAYLSGVSVDKERIKAVIISNVIAAIGIVVYAQSYGFIELYNAPLMMAFPAVSAILIGGATENKANVYHAILGTYMFQTIYLISVPIANQLLLPEISEILRMIISNGIILYAILRKRGESVA